jgi:hypothetical protein
LRAKKINTMTRQWIIARQRRLRYLMSANHKRLAFFLLLLLQLIVVMRTPLQVNFEDHLESQILRIKLSALKIYGEMKRTNYIGTDCKLMFIERIGEGKKEKNILFYLYIFNFPSPRPFLF